MNTSATGGYLAPTNSELPGGLSLEDFLHNVIVGITGLDNKDVRPKWQSEPGKQPGEPTYNWCAFGVTEDNADSNAFMEGGVDVSRFERHTELQLFCSFYGPKGFQNAGIFRDGFQVTQNREVLFSAEIGFKECGRIMYIPELVNNRWFPRSDITITLKRKIKRTYSILPFASAGGDIQAQDTNGTTQDSMWIV